MNIPFQVDDEVILKVAIYFGMPRPAAVRLTNIKHVLALDFGHFEFLTREGGWQKY